MLNVKSAGEAGRIILDRFGMKRMPKETVSLEAAVGRALCGDVSAAEHVPAFDRSTVDGYAVCAADTFGCSESIPALLTCVGEVLMGQKPPRGIRIGECMAVPTGGELPPGADAMVMLEYAETFGDGTVGIQKSAAPGACMIFKGDDVKPGERVLCDGQRLKAKDVGALAAMGLGSVAVYKRPKVAVISTGDELIEPGTAIAGAQIYDVNGPMLCAALREWGCVPLDKGIIRDEYALLRAALDSAVQEADMVLLSGGSSVGARDAAQRVMEDLGELLFHGVAIKPGKPTLCAELGGVPVLGLPGHPVAAYFIASLFAQPLLAAFTASHADPLCVPATLGADIPSNHGREECVAVRLSGGMAQPVMGKSGLITTLSQADGYIRIPREAEGVRGGSRVDVFLFGGRA